MKWNKTSLEWVREKWSVSDVLFLCCCFVLLFFVVVRCQVNKTTLPWNKRHSRQQSLLRSSITHTISRNVVLERTEEWIVKSATKHESRGRSARSNNGMKTITTRTNKNNKRDVVYQNYCENRQRERSACWFLHRAHLNDAQVRLWIDGHCVRTHNVYIG